MKDRTIWELAAHKTAVKRTVKLINGSNSRHKVTQIAVVRVIKAMSMYAQAMSYKVTSFKFFKKFGGSTLIPGLGYVRPFYYVTLHFMYLNGEFTEQEWKYIRYELYPKDFNNYFKHYDNKGEYKGTKKYDKNYPIR